MFFFHMIRWISLFEILSLTVQISGDFGNGVYELPFQKQNEFGLV